ncbi:hypothetical protein E6C67_14145 [Azospirillum sp. TSA2s]|uniref:hypothetical protein n=1 Tax=Azospirillum sp. TSA2s TaxID=709810 RepID=UPI0010AA8F5C|nr:hypothetical protein [Azospirillum sp. TSA2s]QCG94971.1 hypothetical protein E6C67_14145 [Azospirillum sp. TSA2s]
MHPKMMALFGVGGCALAASGRRGDTIMAHLSPKAAEALKAVGGSGGTNPATGLREYAGGLDWLQDWWGRAENAMNMKNAGTWDDGHFNQTWGDLYNEKLGRLQSFDPGDYQSMYDWARTKSPGTDQNILDAAAARGITLNQPQAAPTSSVPQASSPIQQPASTPAYSAPSDPVAWMKDWWGRVNYGNQMLQQGGLDKAGYDKWVNDLYSEKLGTLSALKPDQYQSVFDYAKQNIGGGTLQNIYDAAKANGATINFGAYATPASSSSSLGGALGKLSSYFQQLAGQSSNPFSSGSGLFSGSSPFFQSSGSFGSGAGSNFLSSLFGAGTGSLFGSGSNPFASNASTSATSNPMKQAGAFAQSSRSSFPTMTGLI